VQFDIQGGKIYPHAGEYFYAEIEVRIHIIIGRTRRTWRPFA